MITDKAHELAIEIRKLEARNAPLIEKQIVSRALFDELFSSCDPTADEFDIVTYFAIVCGRDLYRLSHNGFQQRRWYRRLLRGLKWLG